LNLDARDLEFWGREARIQSIRLDQSRAWAARLGAIEGKDYKRAISVMEKEIGRLESRKTQAEVVDENWQKLEQKGKG